MIDAARANRLMLDVQRSERTLRTGLNAIRMQSALIQAIEVENLDKISKIFALQDCSSLPDTTPFALGSSMSGTRLLGDMFARETHGLKLRFRFLFIVLALVIWIAAGTMALLSKTTVATSLFVSGLIVLFGANMAANVVNKRVHHDHALNRGLNRVLKIGHWLQPRKVLPSRQGGGMRIKYCAGDTTTALHLACSLQSPSVVGWMLSRGAFLALKTQDSRGFTPLQIAGNLVKAVVRDHTWSRRRYALLPLYRHPSSPDDPFTPLACGLQRLPKAVLRHLTTFL